MHFWRNRIKGLIWRGSIRGLGPCGRLIITQIVCFAIISICYQVSAKTFSLESLDRPKFLLSFGELNSLKKLDRLDYLRQVSMYLANTDFNKSASHQPNWLSSLISIANAHHQYRCVGGGVPIRAGTGRCGVSSYAGFSCANNYEICNPFLFGVRSDGRPFCYRNATTKLCYQSIVVGRNSNMDLVMTAQNREAYNSFAQDLEKICSGNYRVMESASNLNSACRMVQRQTDINRRRQLASFDRSDARDETGEDARDTASATPPPEVSNGSCTQRVIGRSAPTFNHRTRDDRSFIRDMTPLAVEIQEATGFPASILIAKAILESASGSSGLARRSNNYAGMSCFSGMTGWGTEQLGPPVWSINHSVRSRCYSSRPASEGGRYRDYEHPYDSILASINLLGTGRYFTRHSFLRTRGITRNMPESMSRMKDNYNEDDYRNILTILDRVYAPDQRDCSSCPASNNNYDGNLLSLIRRYDLRSIDQMRPCSSSRAPTLTGVRNDN